MKDFNKIRYAPLKYQNEIRSISNPKKSGINLNDTNFKYKNIQPLKNINFNNYNFIRNKYLNYHYSNTEINNNINYNNYNTNNNQFNKSNGYNNFYSNKFKDKIINDIKDNFNIDNNNNNKKKNFYVNVNFNLNQNYNIPNINNNKINRSLSVQNYYETKNNINNINNKVNLDNNSYNNSILNNNYKDNKSTNAFKYIFEQKDNSLLNKNEQNNNGTKVLQRNNKSYTQIINNKLLENHPKDFTNEIKVNNNYNYLYNNNYKNIKVLTEPTLNNNNNNNEQILLNLEYKMNQSFKLNKSDSKGKNYNIIRKIFEEAINVLNLTKKEKKFFKLILLKYHEIVYAFSQDNKSLAQSSENLKNLNFTLDKKYLDLEKRYKILLKENQDMKNILSIENNNNVNNINNNNENMMYKSIKSMEFDMNTSYKKEEKYEKDNDDLNKDIKLININQNEKEKEKEKESKRLKSENIKKRREEFNKLNINDLDSLYFNDKINDIHCYNSKKNYDKVPKIRFLSQCK